MLGGNRISNTLGSLVVFGIRTSAIPSSRSLSSDRSVAVFVPLGRSLARVALLAITGLGNRLLSRVISPTGDVD